MIRTSTISLSNANKGKLDTLVTLTDEMTVVVNKYIDVLWEKQDFKSKYVTTETDTWLSSRLQQCLGKQALEIIKSQRKKKKKTKPVFKGKSFNLDSRMVDFRYDKNSFDIWVRLGSLGNKLQIKFPSRKHRHFNKYKDWEQKKSICLRRNVNNEFSVGVFFEKDTPLTKEKGKTIGVDIGYKKLLITSENETLDLGMEKIYEKIARKKQGSRAFKRALVERDNLINRSLNQFDFIGVKEVVCENLKDVKKNTKGKKSKHFNNKLQRWSYPKVLEKLSRLTDENKVLFTKVNPAYTSQTCSLCGVVDKKSRNGTSFKCITCGNEIDADLNAAINLSHMGVYSPRALYTKHDFQL
jgi:putative transposase